MPDIEIDAMGIQCPMPVVQVSKALKEIESSQTIFVTADDPAFGADIKAYCNVTGNILTSLEEKGGVFSAIVTKK